MTHVYERVDPTGEHDERQLRLHIERYDFARRMLRPGPVLDVGCGVGYGTKMLALEAQPVLGIDVSDEAIEVAQEHYSGLAGAVEYMVADAGCVMRGMWPVDVCNVVALEVLEHLEDPRMALIQIREEFCEPKARLIASTPLNEELWQNPHHLHVWDREDFRALVESAGFTYIGRNFEQPDNWTGVFSAQ